MKHLVFYLIIGFSVSLNAQNANKNGTLVVDLTNFATDLKYVHVAIYDSESNWLKKPIIMKKELVKNGKASVIFEELPYGKYSISCFYDINGNDDLDTSFLGIPNEPLGFSNNASAKFGPPSWKNASFSLTNELKKTSIEF